MKKIQANPGRQPHQLDLFQMMISGSYSNSVEFYQSLPDLYSGKQDKLRNSDRTLPVLSRRGMYNKTPFTLDISPANITVTDPNTKQKSKRAFYKTVIAEFVEHALHKLAINDGFFINDDEVVTDNF